jgi:ankyrin repeat protein
MLNEGEGRLSFTPLHHAVFQNNFNAIALLLKSEEQIDLNKEDCEGRKALDLCFSISSVFKTIRKKWRQ